MVSHAAISHGTYKSVVNAMYIEGDEPFWEEEADQDLPTAIPPATNCPIRAATMSQSPAS